MTEQPRIDLDFDTRWSIANIGLTQLDALIDNWPDATPEDTLDVIARINETALFMLDRIQDLTEALAILGQAIDDHPNPTVRNIAIDGHILRENAANATREATHDGQDKA